MLIRYLFPLFLSIAASLSAQDSPPEFLPEARMIKSDFFSVSNLTIPVTGDELDSIVALKALFPGNFSRKYDGYPNNNTMIWVCKVCPKTVLAGGIYMNEEALMDTFPDKWANFTEAIGTLSYQENNVQKEAVFFSTAPDFPGSGRLEPGILGIAIFEKRKNEWRLNTFSPCVAAEGTFQSADEPQHTVPAGNQTFFELDGGNANGAGASFLYYDKYLFGVLHGKLSVLLKEYSTTCENFDDRMTHWATSVVPIPDQQEFPDLLLITKGYLDINGYGIDDFEFELEFWKEQPWWNGLEKYLNGQKNSSFNVTRRYHFDGLQYVLAETTFGK
jgi:hypothetical protein